MQISMIVNTSDCRGERIRLWRGKWTGNFVALYKHIGMKMMVLRSLFADEGKSGFDLSYKMFPVLLIYLFLRCLANMFSSRVLALSSFSDVPTDRLCKAL